MWKYLFRILVDIISQIVLYFFLDNFCTKYCQNGICMNNQTGYSCTCPPGTSLDYLLNCVGK
jgi:hypothetical protein